MAAVFSSGTGASIAITPWSQLTATNWVTVDAELVARLQMVDRDHFLPNTRRWGPCATPGSSSTATARPSTTRTWRAGRAAAAVPPIDSQTPPNQDICQLWSTGPNMVDEAGAERLAGRRTDDHPDRRTTSTSRTERHAKPPRPPRSEQRLHPGGDADRDRDPHAPARAHRGLVPRHAAGERHRRHRAAAHRHDPPGPPYRAPRPAPRCCCRSTPRTAPSWG